MRRCALVLSVTLGLSACQEASPPPEAPAPAAESAARPAAKPAARSELKPAADARLGLLESCAAAEVEIERLRKAKPGTDWAAIAERFERCAFLVREVDRRHSLRYEEAIRAALKHCAAGAQPRVHQQTLAKGLQHVAVLALQDELDALAAKDATLRAQAVARAAAIYQGIRPTFIRRDKDFFAGTPTLAAAADQALEALRQAAPSGAAAALGARRDLEDAITRTYALSLLYEVQGIAKLRDTDRAACDVKKREAELFHAIIQPRLERRAPAADAALAAMLAADYPAWDPAAAEANIQQGLPDVPLR